LADVDLHLPQTTQRMKLPMLRGDQLHVLNEERDNRNLCSLRDVVQAWLAGRDVDAVTTRAFREDHERELTGCATKGFQLLDAARVQLPTFQQKADVVAEKSFDPGRVPDLAVAEHDNRVTARTPAKRAEQHGVDEADVVADEQVALAGLQRFEIVNAAQKREREQKVRAQPHQPLDEDQRVRGTGLRNLGHAALSAMPWIPGGTGHRPVAAGDPPAARRTTDRQQAERTLFVLRLGGKLPPRTGRWPVPPARPPLRFGFVGTCAADNGAVHHALR